MSFFEKIFEYLNSIYISCLFCQNKSCEHILAGMTSGIRSNWVQDITKCIATAKNSKTESELDSPVASESSSRVTSNNLSDAGWRNGTTDSDFDTECQSNDSSVATSSNSESQKFSPPPQFRDSRPAAKTNCTWPFTPTVSTADSSFSVRSLPEAERPEVRAKIAQPIFGLDYNRGKSQDLSSRYVSESVPRDPTKSIYPRDSNNVTKRRRKRDDSEDVWNDAEETSTNFSETRGPDASYNAPRIAPSSKIIEHVKSKSPKRVKSPPPLDIDVRVDTNWKEVNLSISTVYLLNNLV